MRPKTQATLGHFLMELLNAFFEDRSRDLELQVANPQVEQLRVGGLGQVHTAMSGRRTYEMGF
jgi:hypothetical protein